MTIIAQSNAKLECVLYSGLEDTDFSYVEIDKMQSKFPSK